MCLMTWHHRKRLLARQLMVPTRAGLDHHLHHKSRHPLLLTTERGARASKAARVYIGRNWRPPDKTRLPKSRGGSPEPNVVTCMLDSNATKIYWASIYAMHWAACFHVLVHLTLTTKMWFTPLFQKGNQIQCGDMATQGYMARDRVQIWNYVS